MNLLNFLNQILVGKSIQEIKLIGKGMVKNAKITKVSGLYGDTSGDGCISVTLEYEGREYENYDIDNETVII